MLRLAIKQIKQIDNHHFQIEWSDDTNAIYHLDKLQKNCPCAACVDESTNIRKPLATELIDLYAYANTCTFI